MNKIHSYCAFLYLHNSFSFS